MILVVRLSRVCYQSELMIRAAGRPVTLHFLSQLMNAGKSFQLAMDCAKWSVTPDSLSYTSLKMKQVLPDGAELGSSGLESSGAFETL